MKIAVIGTGAAGLSAAWRLAPHHDITVFERDSRLGGHAHTVEIDIAGEALSVDTGFIVFNRENYPQFSALLDDIGAQSEESDMSFSVSLGQGRREYFGDPPGLFAQRSNVLRPSHWVLVRDLVRFYAHAPKWLEEGPKRSLSLGAFLDQNGYSDVFARQHILPMAAAIWSTPASRIRDFPAETFIRFFLNHRLFDLDLKARPIWRTVSGGSREYVKRLARTFWSRVRMNAEVVGLRRAEDGVYVRAVGEEEERFDQVVLATHTDQSLALLGEGASAMERRLLGSIEYRDNDVILHRDPALMPKRKRVWACWNYLAEDEHDARAPVSVSYWMNKLQNLETQEPVFVSLNPQTEPNPDLVYQRFSYAHPQFDQKAVEAQKYLPRIQGRDRVWYCGAWCGYGFHEDAVAAGLAVAEALGGAQAETSRVQAASPAARHAAPLRQAG